jgi:hypothetical protein
MNEDEFQNRVYEKLLNIEHRLTRIETKLDNTVLHLSTKQIAAILLIIISAITGVSMNGSLL